MSQTETFLSVCNADELPTVQRSLTQIFDAVRDMIVATSLDPVQIAECLRDIADHAERAQVLSFDEWGKAELNS